MKGYEITRALKDRSGISSNLQKLEWLKNHDEDLKLSKTIRKGGRYDR